MTALIVGLVSLVGLSSCLEVEQTITLHRDGSGTITEEILLGAQMLALMGGGDDGEGGLDPLARLRDRRTYELKATEYGPEVEYSKMKHLERNGAKGVLVTYSFKDINSVRFSPGSAVDGVDGAEEAPARPEDPLTFQYDGEILTIVFPDPPAGDGREVSNPEEPEPKSPAGDALMTPMLPLFKEMKVSAKLHVSDGIAETDASHVIGSTITLLNLEFAEIVKNPEGMRVLEAIDPANRAELRRALKDVKGILVETKERVRVKVR